MDPRLIILIILILLMLILSLLLHNFEFLFDPNLFMHIAYSC